MSSISRITVAGLTPVESNGGEEASGRHTPVVEVLPVSAPELSDTDSEASDVDSDGDLEMARVRALPMLGQPPMSRQERARIGCIYAGMISLFLVALFVALRSGYNISGN